MASIAAYLARAAASTVADRAVSSPLYRWTWRPLTGAQYVARLPEIRPADALSAGDMMRGKYLLGGRLVETGGVSPFSVASDDAEWKAELHSFAWLRHFAETRSGAEREFARTLVLDWIGRFGRFERAAWRNVLTARRVHNWLTHFDLITANASERQQSIVARCLSAQVHALEQRGRLDTDPEGKLGAAIALLAVALSHEEGDGPVAARTARLVGRLTDQLDTDGLHRSRSARVQFELLQYLVPVRLALVKASPDAARPLAAQIERMHVALARQTLTTGEPAYFNGTGQMPLEMLLAVQSHGGQRSEGDYIRAASGYGLIQAGRGKLIADGGAIPPPDYAAHMHAGALAFEFSYGNALIVGNCGPAPARLGREAKAFRGSAAHSTLDMPAVSAARFGVGPLVGGRAFARSRGFRIKVDAPNTSLEMGTTAYVARYGLRHGRALSLIDGGRTLIGQDMLSQVRKGAAEAVAFTLRFHLGPGVSAEPADNQGLVRLSVKGAEPWVFLWEGAEAAIEPSVRQSLHHGMIETEQIVLRGLVAGRHEIAWSFALQSG